MQIQETVVFACTRERLWSYIEDPEKQKLWMKGVLSNETTSPGREGVGSTFRMKIKEGHRIADYEGEVTEYDKPHRLEIRMWGGNFPKGMRMRVDYQLSDVGGATQLDYSCQTEGFRPGFFLRMILPFCKLFARRQLKGFLRTLQTLVEAKASAA